MATPAKRQGAHAGAVHSGLAHASESQHPCTPVTMPF